MEGNNTSIRISPGSSVLVDQPSSQSNGQSSVFEFISHEGVDSVIAVMRGRSADSFLRGWNNRIGTIPSFARVISVGQSMRSTKARTGSQNVVRPIKCPDDLTAVQLEIASTLQDAPEGTVFILDSLTPFFEHATLYEIVSFVETVTKYIETTKAVGYFLIDASAHDETAIAALRSHLGLMIEQDDMGWLVRSAQDLVSGEESLDVLFDILRSRQRREVLRYLVSSAGTTSLNELATAMAKQETQEKVVTDETLEQYVIRLSQVNLPKLEDKGYVSYDSDTQLITSCEATRRAEPFLALAEE